MPVSLSKIVGMEFGVVIGQSSRFNLFQHFGARFTGHLLSFFLLLNFIFILPSQVQAQCTAEDIAALSSCDAINANGFQEELVQGVFHGQLIKTASGFSVTGKNMAPAGDANQLTLVPVDTANGYTLPAGVKLLHGTIAALGQAAFVGSDGVIYMLGTNVSGIGMSPASVSGPAFGPSLLSIPGGGTVCDVERIDGTVDTLGIQVSGELYVTGRTVAGLLAGASDGAWSLIPMPSGVTVEKFQIGKQSVMILGSDDNFYTMGQNLFVGDGTAITSSTAAPLLMTQPPLSVPGAAGFVQFDFGSGGTYVVLDADGTVHVMGANAMGQLGTNDIVDKTSWTKAGTGCAGGVLTDVAYVSTFKGNQWDTTNVILTDGSIMGWGEQSLGHLGQAADGIFSCPVAPCFEDAALNPIPDPKNHIGIAAGGHVVPTITSDAMVCISGHSLDGAFGDGSADNANRACYQCNTVPGSDLDSTCAEPLDSDKDGIPDEDDLDDDNDGIPDTVEGTEDTDEDGIPDSLDQDSDNDGIPDTIEAGSPDSDGDGVVDCATAPSFSADGFCDDVDPANGGTAVPDPDTDEDGIADRIDLDSDNDGCPDIEEAGGLDVDGNGIIDCTVPFGDDGFCPDTDFSDGGTPEPDFDTDMDGVKDRIDLDSDNDGLTDAEEAGGLDVDSDGSYDCSAAFGTDGFCPDVDPADGGTPTIPKTDTDGDGVPDHEDLDSDNDGLPDVEESGGLDEDEDGIIDCSVPFGTDGYCPDVDPGDGGTPPAFPDTDEDGVPDHEDLDSDNDGIPDTIESMGPDEDGDGIIDCTAPFTPDGYCPDVDPSDGGTPPSKPDSDGDGTPDHEDLDSDGDEIPDSIESGAPDADEDGIIDCTVPFGPKGYCPDVDPSVGGTPVPLPDEDGDGRPDYLDVPALQSPVYGIWNGFYRQENVVSMRNSSEESVEVTLTLFDIQGTVLSIQDLTVPKLSSFDVSVNALPGFSAGFDTGSYGFLSLEFDPENGFDAQMNLYRLTPDASDVEFAIVKPFENISTGPTYAMFNTIQPSQDPAQSMNWMPQWAQIVNLDSANTQGFTYNLYDAEGTLIYSENIGIPPFGRRDRQAGHELPLGIVGLVEVVPDVATTEYIAQVFYYSQDELPQYQPETFSFALGTDARTALSGNTYATVSRGASGQTWLAIANAGAGAADIDVDFYNSTGFSGTESANVPAKGQVHLLADNHLSVGETGWAKIKTASGDFSISEARTYFRNSIGQVTAAYVSPGRELSARAVMASAWNSFFTAVNWVRLHNVTAIPQDAVIEVYDLPGINLLGTLPVTVAPNATLEQELTIALGLPVNTYGVVRVVPTNTGAVFGDTLRVKSMSLDPSQVDFSKPIPIR